MFEENMADGYDSIYDSCGDSIYMVFYTAESYMDAFLVFLPCVGNDSVCTRHCHDRSLLGNEGEERFFRR